MADEETTTEETTQETTSETTQETTQQTTETTTENQLPAVTVEQFRQILAGDDPKFLKQLERYNDIPGMRKAWQSKDARISEGFKPEAFPAEGTDEQKNAWREANGIPAAHDGYFSELGDGIVIGEDDKPIFDSLAEALHAANLPKAAGPVLAKWYTDWVAEQQAAVFDEHTAEKTAMEDALVKEFGPAEYRVNKQNVSDLLSQYLPAEMVEAFQEATLPDGRKAFNKPEILKGFMTLARTLNPVPTLVGHGNDPGKSIDGRLAEIAAIRKKDYDSYMKNESLLKEERELLDHKQRLSSRAA